MRRSRDISYLQTVRPFPLEGRHLCGALLKLSSRHLGQVIQQGALRPVFDVNAFLRCKLLRCALKVLNLLGFPCTALLLLRQSRLQIGACQMAPLRVLRLRIWNLQAANDSHTETRSTWKIYAVFSARITGAQMTTDEQTISHDGTEAQSER